MRSHAIVAAVVSVLIMAVSVPAATPEPRAGKRIPPLPSGTSGPGRFGAYYTQLKYYPEWDKQWRVGPHADVVVGFDDGGHKFVFWRGTNYIPHWVTENGIWYNNEFNEAWETVGSSEPMSDKQCRYSHVRVIETNPARVVVHWRYALCDVNYRIAWPDELTGWGDWTDEYYVIYPDAVGTRHIILHSAYRGDDPRHTDDAGHEWQEGILVYNAHSPPEESVELDAVHVANMQGQTGKWSWEKHGKPTNPTPDGSNIVLMNVKSDRKPFVVSPEGCELFAYEGSQGGSHFRWRDHWPTTMEPVPGRNASGEKAAHGSFFHIARIPIYQSGDNWISKVLLHGMTELAVGELVPLAESWLKPAELKVVWGAVTSAGYNPAERAYMLECRQTDKPSHIELNLAASEDSPVINPTFVLRNWGTNGATLEINGKKIEQGKDFRLGHHHTLEGTQLVLWVRFTSVESTRIAISPSRLVGQSAFKRYCMASDLKDDTRTISQFSGLLKTGFHNQIAEAMRDAGVLNIEFYQMGNRLLMIMETTMHFDLRTYEKRIASLPEYQKWQASIEGHLKPLPQARDGSSWVLLERAYKLDQKQEYKKVDGYVQDRLPASTIRVCEARELVDDPAEIARYKSLHAMGKAWPEITQALKDIGIVDNEIYTVGNRTFEFYEVRPDFHWEKSWEQLESKPAAGKWAGLVGPIDRPFRDKNGNPLPSQIMRRIFK